MHSSSLIRTAALFLKAQGRGASLSAAQIDAVFVSIYHEDENLCSGE